MYVMEKLQMQCIKGCENISQNVPIRHQNIRNIRKLSAKNRQNIGGGRRPRNKSRQKRSKRGKN